MTVYTCSPDLASILTCIYEAWNSRLGYRNVRLMTEPVGNLELFCDYCHVEPDTEKAASVTRSIQKKIGAAAWRLVYLCAMSERSDAPDIIYRFLFSDRSNSQNSLSITPVRSASLTSSSAAQSSAQMPVIPASM